MKFTKPIYVNYIELTKPLKLDRFASLKCLSVQVGTDKNLDCIAEAMTDTERWCLNNAVVSDRSVKIPSLRYYKSGLNKEIYDFAKPSVTRTFMHLMPSSKIPCPVNYDKGTHQDLKLSEFKSTRIIEKHCGDYNQCTVDAFHRLWINIVDIVQLSENDYILILLCPPNLNCPNHYFP